VEWIPVFTKREYFEVIIDSLKFAQKKKGLKLFSYVILDNHFHMIISANGISKTVQSIKAYSAKQILKLLHYQRKFWLLNQFRYYKKRFKPQSTYQVWQEGYHPKLIRGMRMFNQKMNYIHNNPVKLGLVDRPEYWRYSSARNILLGDHSVITIDRYN
jgi:REP element-mobilizing transposase RayT